MFIKILTETLMIFLITYALMDILCRFAKLFTKQNEQKGLHRKLIVYCDNEDNIEQIVRSSVKLSFSAKCEIILVLNKNTHENHVIAEKLLNEFPHLKIVQLSDINIKDLFGELAS